MTAIWIQQKYCGMVNGRQVKLIQNHVFVYFCIPLASLKAITYIFLKLGPTLPKPLYSSSMVEIGENLYIVGGVSSYGSEQKEMHQLSCVSGSCSWTTLIQQLTVARVGLVAIPVDDIFCHSPCQKGDFNPTIF